MDWAEASALDFMTLSQAGHPPTRIDTEARVAITKVPEGFRIPYVELRTRATVPGISQEAFQQEAERAKAGCPVSLALAGTDIRLSAELIEQSPPATIGHGQQASPKALSDANKSPTSSTSGRKCSYGSLGLRSARRQW